MQDQRLIVVAEKVATKNGRMYKIIDVRATPLKKLPLKYRSDWPRAIPMAGGGLDVITQDGRRYYVTIGEVVTTVLFDAILEDLKAAGDKLHKIRQEIKASLADWHGIRTEVI